MDVKELKERIEAARRVEATVNGATFTMVMPTDHQWRVCVQESRGEDGRVIDALAYRRLLERALTGWSGVKCSDMMPGESEEALPFSPAARELLLDHRLDIVDELTIAFGAWLRDHRAKQEESEKNSSGASSGS